MRAKNYSRREFLRFTGAGVGAGFLELNSFAMAVPAATSVRAIAFDAFPIFDSRLLSITAKEFFPDKGEMLANIWSTKLFGYTWLETAAGRYEGFESLAQGALEFAAESVGVKLSGDARMKLIEVYSQLNLWPDVKNALEHLRAAKIRLAFLSNLSGEMLRANMRHTGIEEYFEFALSTDRVRRFKPAPEAYKMAIDAFGLPKEAIGFAAFGGWDAAGATWFGYRTAWVNRMNALTERLEPKPAVTSTGMEGVLLLAGIAAG